MSERQRKAGRQQQREAPGGSGSVSVVREKVREGGRVVVMGVAVVDVTVMARRKEICSRVDGEVYGGR